MDEPHRETLLETRVFRVEQITRTLSDGREAKLQVVCHPGAVVILPLLDRDRVCLIRNQRDTVGRLLWELPAGTREANEPPATTAVRELKEETGFRAGRIDHVHSFYMSPGILDEQMHFYVARDLEAGAPSLEDNETIETEVMSWSDAMQLLADGQIQDAKTLVALLWYDRLRSLSTDKGGHSAGRES